MRSERGDILVGFAIAVGIIALFAAIFSIRAHVHVEYEKDLLVYAKWAFLKIPIFPRPKKPPKEKKEEPAKKQEENAPKEEKPKEEKPKGANPLAVLYGNEKISGIIDILKKLLQVVDKFGRRLINSFVIDEMFLDITVSKSDAAQTAEEYGKMCRRVFPVTGAVVANCNVRKYSVNIDADYLADGRSDAAFSMEISLNLRKVINAVLAFAFGALFKVGIRLLKGIKPKKSDGGANNGSQSPTEQADEDEKAADIGMTPAQASMVMVKKPYGKYEEGTVTEPEVYDSTSENNNPDNTSDKK